MATKKPGDAIATIVFPSKGKKEDATFTTVPMNKVFVEDGHNIRKHIDKEAVEGLAAQIKANGLSTPIQVEKTKDGKFKVAHGERRFRAAKLLGWSDIPVVIKEADPVGAICTMLQDTSDVAHVPLTMLERADAFGVLHKKHKLTPGQIALRSGMSAKTVSRGLKIATESSDEVRKRLSTNVLSAGAALALIGYKPDQEKKLLDSLSKTAGGDLSRVTEDEVKRAGKELARQSKTPITVGKEKSKNPKKRDKMAVAASSAQWKKPTENNLQIQQLCYSFVTAGADGADDYSDAGTSMFAHGMLAYALWNRGDLVTDISEFPEFIKDGKFDPNPVIDKGSKMSREYVNQLVKLIKAEADAYGERLEKESGASEKEEAPKAEKKSAKKDKAKKSKKSAKKGAKSVSEDDAPDTGADPVDDAEDEIEDTGDDVPDDEE